MDPSLIETVTFIVELIVTSIMLCIMKSIHFASHVVKVNCRCGRRAV